MKTRVWRECSISRQRVDCTVEVYMFKESKERITVLWQVGQLQERAVKSSEFGEEKL